ncbi:MAG: efflux RND transporter periplasmic adaptor subunit [Longimicrobiales bacterium]|nr:efflux RND transporter periplasmic adaptor subunit [Longimicrobiales bacterium]
MTTTTRADRENRLAGAAHLLARRRRLAGAAHLLALIAGVTLSACGEGEPAAEEHEHEGTEVVTQWNEATELFLEYPYLLGGRSTGNWAIHLTDMDDFQPIRSGTLTVNFLQNGAVAESYTVEGVARDGIFLLDPFAPAAGAYQVELILESPQADSRHLLEEVQVYVGEEDLPHAHVEEDGGAIAFLKEQQWQIPFAVAEAVVDTLHRTVWVPGEVAAADGAMVQVSAPVDGIADAAANRHAPSVGERVRAGEVLVVLLPTAQDGSFAQALARVERLEREAARAQRLYDAGAIAEKRLEESRHDLEVARAEAEALGAAGTQGDYRLRLAAPISGEVASRTFVPGGRVAAGEALYTLVDPARGWLRLRLPADEAAAVPPGARATFTLEGSEAVLESGPLISVGSVMDPVTRTVPAVFDLSGLTRRFTFGQLARAAVPVDGTVTGLVVPNSAIVDDNGTLVAYVQAGGETFERRVLNLGATDGRRTVVLSGIEAGEMVTTTGAYQVRLASMSGGEFAGGHAH